MTADQDWEVLCAQVPHWQKLARDQDEQTPAGGPNERRQTTAQRQSECGTWRGKMQILVFDLWRDGVLTEQQCAEYTGENLVQVRNLLDCEAARRGFKCREDAQT